MTEISKSLTLGGIGFIAGGVCSTVYGAVQLYKGTRTNPGHEDTNTFLISGVSYVVAGLATVAFGSLICIHGQREPNNYLNATPKDSSHISYLFDRT